jgi:hypothetical protein
MPCQCGHTYEIFNRRLAVAENDGLRVIGHLALGLGVDADQLQLIPPAGYTTLAYAHQGGKAARGGKRGAHMASISSSMFQPCSELIGTALGMR